MIRIKCVLNALGTILLIVAAAMLMPLLWSIVQGDGKFYSFFFTLVIYAMLGCMLVLSTKDRQHIRTKEGFLIVTLSWLVVSVIGFLPFYLYIFITII